MSKDFKILTNESSPPDELLSEKKKKPRSACFWVKAISVVFLVCVLVTTATFWLTIDKRTTTTTVSVESLLYTRQGAGGADEQPLVVVEADPLWEESAKLTLEDVFTWIKCALHWNYVGSSDKSDASEEEEEKIVKLSGIIPGRVSPPPVETAEIPDAVADDNGGDNPVVAKWVIDGWVPGPAAWVSRGPSKVEVETGIPDISSDADDGNDDDGGEEEDVNSSKVSLVLQRLRGPYCKSGPPFRDPRCES